MDIQYLDTDEKVARFLETLEAESAGCIAVDIEGEYNLHQYGEKLCLVQIYYGSRQIIIDPFTVAGSHIARLFGNPDIKKIMYDASSDQKLILKQCGVRIQSIIDLRPAAELLELERQDLSSVIQLYLGIEKSKNYQKYDWTKRPVEAGALEYAMNDVIYLFRLRDELFKDMEAAGLTEEYWKRNEAVGSRKIDLNREPGFFRKPAFSRLKKGEQNLVRKIFYIREGYAEKYNVPPHQVFSNQDLVPLGTGRTRVNNIRLYGQLASQDREALRSDISEALKKG